ncbi:related to 5-oxo-L-prolinase [Cephalotrichum gorgonifer]|uniref:Related to 5-oxo-L-prolinase n=1 Tax=Cephalotrichum gorgonifer TaxID=2041049 RepID=A0AAE8MWU4_9PEZI|nr:related to 5-oxo-L-prolinase [Cephalotrichum gorgonifer]
MKGPTSGVTIAIDRGGTFTDVLALIPGKPDFYFKLLSVDPANYEDATIEGIRVVLSHVRGKEVPRGEPLDAEGVSVIRMGTTVATNALLERKGSKCALLITKGFGDLTVIGDQSRPRLFDLDVRKPGALHQKVVEVDERVTQESFAEDPLERSFSERVNGSDVKQGVTGEVFRVLTPLDEAAVTKQLEDLYADGFRSIAVCLLHGYNFQEHEKRIGEIAEAVGFEDVCLSHALLPVIKLVHRAHSTTAGAYLTPETRKYIRGFLKGFKSDSEHQPRIEFMQSDGGLVSYDKFSGLRAILSGPAGGVVGYARTCYEDTNAKPVIGFDMGGTSTDVSRYGGSYEHITNSVTAGVHINCPQLDINTVAAGGGSMLFFRNGLFVVGPESAGAHPGPACYLKGGPLTVTDANLMLGRLLPETFPRIFGPNEDQPLGVDVTRKKFIELTKAINDEIRGNRPEMTVEEVALGFLQVANLNMAKPIRALTDSRGYHTAAHNLASFGGAGGQHACDIAESLGISRVVIHKYSSILSAYGIALADVVEERQEPASEVYDSSTSAHFAERLAALSKEASEALSAQGIAEESIQIEKFLNMRYQGSDSQLMIPAKGDDGDFVASFTSNHLREFSFIDDARKIIVDDVRVRASGSTHRLHERSYQADLQNVEQAPAEFGSDTKFKSVYFEGGWRPIPILALGELKPGSIVAGPAILLDKTQTIVVTPSSQATVLERHVVIDLVIDNKKSVSAGEVDPVQLAVFGNRFMSIAEDMGRTLQKISISTNVKERLDFSCALFDGSGALTANAPHVPVHLGSMSRAVKIAMKRWEGNLFPGDVVATNHPVAGGTHLPDITLISPVFDESGKHIDFFVAARAHHAEIGGIAPGSMPSDSVELYQEGVAFEQWKIISQGKFDDAGVQHHFIDVPGSYPGCSPSRRVHDNIADLKAQVAANQKGISLIHGLFEEYQRETVLFYMRAVKQTAAVAVRDLLRRTAEKFKGQLPLTAVDYMDDGSQIALSVSIDAEKGTAVFDFTGTGPESFNSLNAPIAITHSAILYCLRCLIASDIPLNEGCMEPVEVIVPEGTILNPSPSAAVCAGNGCTSQRITDVVLKAFRACAASHGCMNILSFGNGGYDKETGTFVPGYGYGETIAGGCGAGPGWNGYSGSQVHMTNTKITDPEILEKRYPVVLRQFCLRPNTGGKGRWTGGDGVVREFEFTEAIHASVLTQRRVYSPYGMAGGSDGERGINYLGRMMPDGSLRWINVGGTKEVSLAAGDRIKICTPGGGGYGVEGEVNGDGPMVGDVKVNGNGIGEHVPRANGSLREYESNQAASN